MPDELQQLHKAFTNVPKCEQNVQVSPDDECRDADRKRQHDTRPNGHPGGQQALIVAKKLVTSH